MSTATRTHDRYAARVCQEFGLAAARAILLAGSRLEPDDYPGSDLDFVAIFESPADIPATVPHSGAVTMASTMGASWIGWLGEQEINVTAVSADSVRRAADLYARALSATYLPAPQPSELVVLQRLRTGTVLAGGDYLTRLVAADQLARLPLAAFVIYHCSAAGHLRTARGLRSAGDGFGFEAMMLAAAAALGLATLCAHDRAGASIKKIATGLARLEATHADLPLRRADLLALLRGGDATLRLDLATSVLNRLRRMADERAKDGGGWAEARAALDARI